MNKKKKFFLPCEGVSRGHRIPIPADRGFGGEKKARLHGLSIDAAIVRLVPLGGAVRT